jgi:hypothetical protein
VGLHSAQLSAPRHLCFGRNEEAGLFPVYQSWKLDQSNRLDMLIETARVELQTEDEDGFTTDSRELHKSLTRLSRMTEQSRHVKLF